MIICICNSLRDKEIRGAIASGAERAEEVHARCGAEVDCGCCLQMIGDMVDAARPCAARVLQPAG